MFSIHKNTAFFGDLFSNIFIGFWYILTSKYRKAIILSWELFFGAENTTNFKEKLVFSFVSKCSRM